MDNDINIKVGDVYIIDAPVYTDKIIITGFKKGFFIWVYYQHGDKESSSMNFRMTLKRLKRLIVKKANSGKQELNELEAYIDQMWADEHSDGKIGHILGEILDKIQEIKNRD